MSARGAAGHVPVLLDEAIAALAVAPGALVVDATFGAGGYTRRLLDAGAIVHAFATPASRGMPIDSQMARLDSVTAVGELAAIDSAIPRAVACRSASGTISSTRPNSSALRAASR